MRISDWSSDVCSSDLDGLALIFLLLFFVVLFGLLTGRPNAALPVSKGALVLELDGVVTEQPAEVDPLAALSGGQQLREFRSEERRGGNGCVRTCRSRGCPYHSKKKKYKYVDTK